MAINQIMCFIKPTFTDFDSNFKTIRICKTVLKLIKVLEMKWIGLFTL